MRIPVESTPPPASAPMPPSHLEPLKIAEISENDPLRSESLDAAVQAQEKRWNVISRLRRRQQRRSERMAQTNQERVSRWQRAYVASARVIIDAWVGLEQDDEKRAAWAESMRRRLGLNRIERRLTESLGATAVKPKRTARML